MQRRLFKTGNSIVLSLPREVMEGLRLTDGDEVSLDLELEEKRLVVTKAEKPLQTAGVDENFAGHVEAFINEYRSALEDLAR